jgi:hypothetical protein
MADDPKPKQTVDFERGFALGFSVSKTLESAVRNLADHMNDHTVLLFAIMKHLGKTPEEFVQLLTEEDLAGMRAAAKDSVIITGESN